MITVQSPLTAKEDYPGPEQIGPGLISNQFKNVKGILIQLFLDIYLDLPSFSLDNYPDLLDNYPDLPSFSLDTLIQLFLD